MVKSPPAKAGDVRDESSIPRSRRAPQVGNSTPLQYSCLENSMGREDWQATAREATKRCTCLSTADWITESSF